MMYSAGTCEKCAPYTARVYCLSGRDKRFPKFPNFIRKQGCIHSGCRCMIRPFDISIKNQIYFRGKEYDAITISNRPFIDDRTDEEKHNHEIYLEKKRINDRPYITDTEKEYYHVKYAIPDIAPKSLSGYVRMKNSKTKNFMKIVDAAKQVGIVIDLEE